MQCESATANSTVLRSVYSYPLDCFQSEKGISAMNLSQETRLGWCLAISVWEMKAKMIGSLRSQGVLYRFWYNTLFFADGTFSEFTIGKVIR